MPGTDTIHGTPSRYPPVPIPADVVRLPRKLSRFAVAATILGLAILAWIGYEVRMTRAAIEQLSGVQSVK